MGRIRIFPAATASARADTTSAYTFGNPSPATRLGSGGSGTVTWDNLIIAREWSALSKFPWITPDSTIRIVDTSFDTATRTFSLTWESSDTATYTPLGIPRSLGRKLDRTRQRHPRRCRCHHHLPGFRVIPWAKPNASTGSVRIPDFHFPIQNNKQPGTCNSINNHI